MIGHLIVKKGVLLYFSLTMVLNLMFQIKITQWNILKITLMQKELLSLLQKQTDLQSNFKQRKKINYRHNHKYINGTTLMIMK